MKKLKLNKFSRDFNFKFLFIDTKMFVIYCLRTSLMLATMIIKQFYNRAVVTAYCNDKPLQIFIAQKLYINEQTFSDSNKQFIYIL